MYRLHTEYRIHTEVQDTYKGTGYIQRYRIHTKIQDTYKGAGYIQLYFLTHSKIQMARWGTATGHIHRGSWSIQNLQLVFKFNWLVTRPVPISKHLNMNKNLYFFTNSALSALCCNDIITSPRLLVLPQIKLFSCMLLFFLLSTEMMLWRG